MGERRRSREPLAARCGRGLLDLLFPPKCPFCRRVLEAPRSPVCPRCQPILPWLTGEQARRQVEFTAGCVSPLAYRDAVVQSVRRYKFPGNPSYAAPYGVLVAQCIRDSVPGRLDQVAWAPLSRKRRSRRGFDQAELLARAVARELELPLADVLVKAVDTPPQSDLGGAERRRANALGAYQLRQGAQLTGQRVLLVDDVVTSGATLGECARLLLQAGAEEVLCATLAQARKK